MNHYYAFYEKNENGGKNSKIDLELNIVTYLINHWQIMIKQSHDCGHFWEVKDFKLLYELTFLNKQSTWKQILLRFQVEVTIVCVFSAISEIT